MKGNPHCEHRRVLSQDDIELIRECKKDRDRLRKLSKELTDAKLAEKFECSKQTICRVKIDGGRHYVE